MHEWDALAHWQRGIYLRGMMLANDPENDDATPEVHTSADRIEPDHEPALRTLEYELARSDVTDHSGGGAAT